MADPGLSTVFELNLSGEGVYPESIRASDLAEIITSIEESRYFLALRKDPSLNLDEFIVGLVQRKGKGEFGVCILPTICRKKFI